MQARYVNDAARGPGWGLLVIREARMDAGEACAFSVQRAGDGLHLGSAGWQEAEEVLRPDRVERRGDELLLGVSPAVVDNLDELETYRVILRVEGRPPQCSGLELSAIRYARLASGDGIPVARPEPEAQPEPAALPDPEPHPVPTPEPETPPAVPERKKRLLFLLVPIALLAAAVSAFLWFSAAPEQASAPLPEQQAEVAPPPPASPPVRSPKEQAHAFLRKGGSPAEALALSRTLPADTEEGQDAVFLLQESAAEGGDPEAMIRVGRYYDPSDAAPSGTIVKDAEQARLWYDKALQAGAAEVAVERERLRAWLEGEAAAGSVRAGELLRGMK